MFVGGDQVTAARARGCQRVRSNSERGRDRLEGLQPVCEDWHAKVCLLGVCVDLTFVMQYNVHAIHMLLCRLFGNDCKTVLLEWMEELCISFGI